MVIDCLSGIVNKLRDVWCMCSVKCTLNERLHVYTCGRAGRDKVMRCVYILLHMCVRYGARGITSNCIVTRRREHESGDEYVVSRCQFESKMPGNCHFIEAWLNNSAYSEWILKVSTDSGIARCSVCQCNFSIRNMGEAALNSEEPCEG